MTRLRTEPGRRPARSAFRSWPEWFPAHPQGTQYNPTRLPTPR